MHRHCQTAGRVRLCPRLHKARPPVRVHEKELHGRSGSAFTDRATPKAHVQIYRQMRNGLLYAVYNGHYPINDTTSNRAMGQRSPDTDPNDVAARGTVPLSATRPSILHSEVGEATLHYSRPTA